MAAPQDPRVPERLEALLAALAEQPWSHDFFQTLRRIDAWQAQAPKLGTARRPNAEAVRLGQDVELDMAPSTLSSFTRRPGVPPRLGVRFLGLFGPMGPLPLHLTEHVRERERQHKDAGAARFADIFHHRALLLFYRAWAQAQPAVHLDRPGLDDFSRWVGALIGRTGRAHTGLDGLPDAARLHNAATLASGTRHAEGLTKLLRQHLGVAVQLQEHVPRWVALRPDDRTRLLPPRQAPARDRLGEGAVAGNRVWDLQSACRIVLGPLTLAEYERFLPGEPGVRELRDWVRQYLGLSIAWDLRLDLQGAQVPRLRLPPRDRRGGRLQPLPGRQGCLGRTTWLGRRGPHADRRDLRLRPESDRSAAAEMTLVAGTARAAGLP